MTKQRLTLRSLILLPAILVFGLGSGFFLAADRWKEAQPAELAVIYIGADDCGPCIEWRRADRPQFLASQEFTQLHYREVISSTLFDLSKEEHWPDNLREFRDEFSRLPGAPMWFVVGDEKILLTARGLREWREVALPRLKSLVR